jgi:hypothetical protein
VAYGLIYNLWLCLVGGLIVVAAIYGWTLEPSVDPDVGHEEHEPPEPDQEPGEPAAAEEEGTLVD